MLICAHNQIPFCSNKCLGREQRTTTRQFVSNILKADENSALRKVPNLFTNPLFLFQQLVDSHKPLEVAGVSYCSRHLHTWILLMEVVFVWAKVYTSASHSVGRPNTSSISCEAQEAHALHYRFLYGYDAPSATLQTKSCQLSMDNCAKGIPCEFCKPKLMSTWCQLNWK